MAHLSNRQKWFRFWYDMLRLGTREYSPHRRALCFMILPCCDSQWEEWMLPRPSNDKEASHGKE